MKFKKSSLKKFAIIGFIFVLALAWVMYVIAQNEGFALDDRIWLVGGWNLVTVFTTFEGKGLNELAHTGQGVEICEDFAPNTPGWVFNNTDKKYIIMQNIGKTIDPLFKPTVNFSSGHVWASMWIKVKNNCVLGCGVSTCMTGRR